MPAPPLEIGTHGTIRFRRLDDPDDPDAKPRYQAFAQYRGTDGRTRQYSRTGTTQKKAERRLKAFFAQNSEAQATINIHSATRMSALAQQYLTSMQELADAGDRSQNTSSTYRDIWRLHLEPLLGGLTIGEASVSRCDAALRDLRSRHQTDLVKTARTVLSGMFNVAIRHEAVTFNPIRSVPPIAGRRRKTVQALEPSEAVDLWQKLTELARTPAEHSAVNGRYRPTKISQDVPDLVLWMLGTSERIGNALAVHWPWIDLDEGTAALGPNVIRVRNQGLKLNWGSSKTRDRIIELPEPVIGMLLLRAERPNHQPTGPVFAGAFGGLWDPRNAMRMLREAFDLAGYDWVTSHVFRKTVATVLDDASLSARNVADQLGHADPSVTQKHYMARRARNPRAKAALEAMLATQPARKVIPMEASG